LLRLRFNDQFCAFFETSTWRGSPHSEELHFGPDPPSTLRVPKLYAADVALAASQIDGPRHPAGGNALRHRDFFGLAIGVVDYHAHEINRAAFDAQLNGAESSFADANGDVIVIHFSVYVGDAQPLPTLALCVEGRHGRRQQRHESHNG
jgi:hypothetical protein